MIANTTQLDERFTDMELFSMFNIECDLMDTEVSREILIDTDEVSNPLWVNRKIEQPRDRSVTPRIDGEDKIKDSITTADPGTQARIDALAAHYQNADNEENSAFTD